MKLNRSVLVAVAMMVGSLSAMGCKKGATPEDTSKEQAAAPVAVQPEAEAPAVKEDVTTVLAVRAPAPPALRVEVQGPAPSPRHRWTRGFWRYDRTQYVWVPGYWQDETAYAPYGPPAVRYENPGYAPSAEYFYVPGYWRWSGREYTWYGGRWESRRSGYEYSRARWEQVNGRWVYRNQRWNPERWDRRAGRIERDRRNGHEHRDADRRNGNEHRAHDGNRPAQGHDVHRPAQHTQAPAQGHDEHRPAQHAQAPAQHQAPAHKAPARTTTTTPVAPVRRGHG